jgi:cytochrome c biogenesis protein
MDGLASPAFKVAFKDLWVDHHFDESGNPTSIKSWNSAIAFLQNDEMVASGVTMVNQPLSFKDYTFYQANWNKTYGRISVRVDLIKDKADWQTFVTPGATFPVTIELSLENPASFSFTPLKLVLHDFMPDFRILDGRFVSVSHELKNPAARIVAYDQKGGIVGRAWAFPDDRIMSASHVSNLPFLFTFIGAEPEFESGLQMAYDPGKPLVWAGCFLFTLGLIMGFYVAYREEWIVVFDDDRARIALTGNRPAEMLLPGLEALEKELSEPAETKPDQENSQNE